MEFLYNNFIADFFAWCLNGINSLVGNYWVAIIILTVLIRLAMLPLDLRQRRNQAKMSALGPEINSLKKRYANNPQQLQRKQQELYRKMNVRPMAGCLPMLIQLPILFAFFGAMRLLQTQQMVGLILDTAQYGADAVQLPGFLWVRNFWQPDSGLADIMPTAQEFLKFVQQYSANITPQAMSLLQSQDLLIYSGNLVSVNTQVYNELAQSVMVSSGVPAQIVGNEVVAEFKNGWFILPALSGLALFLQQKFSPQSSANSMMGMNMGQDDQSKEQQDAQGCSNKVMMWVMPIFSIYICVTSPASFALYWFVSSMYAFAQSRVIGFVQKKKEERNKLIVSPVPDVEPQKVEAADAIKKQGKKKKK